MVKLMPIYKVINYDYLAVGDNSDLAIFDFKCNVLVSTNFLLFYKIDGRLCCLDKFVPIRAGDQI